METPSLLLTIGLILLVILSFNIIIAIHEWGHFLAARWRGLRVDRFQIWFGKPIWKKTINGVQYGLGWIPAGGFVSLPQMAPMEAIEGKVLDDEGKPLPPIKPLDKIIVAFAGPLFSFLLAFSCALVLTIVKKSMDVIPTTTVGWVEAGSAAEEAGLQRGDKILAIDGGKVTSWNQPLDSVFSRIVTGGGEKIRFEIERPGVGQMEILSSYKIEEKKSIWKRKGMRQVGLIPMAPEGDITVMSLDDKPNAPAALAGLQAGDVVLAVNGEKLLQYEQMIAAIQASGGEAVLLQVKRGEETRELTVYPVKPMIQGVEKMSQEQKDAIGYRIGARFDAPQVMQEEWVRIGPFRQCWDTVRQMWMTVSSVANPHSSIGVEHLSGPVGISKIQYYLMLMDNPLRRTLEFMVLINVNLALLNLLPFPVLDGGHITIAVMEWIARRPVSLKVLEMLQMAFVFLLLGMMLYVTTKDVADDFGMGALKGAGELEYPPPSHE